MVNARGDQAEGLRRMLAVSRARTIAVVAGTRGAGATSCVVNLATALALQGSRVLVIDENYGANVAAQLGVAPRYDLKHAIAGECLLEEAVVIAPGGIAVVAAAAAVRALPRLECEAQRRAIACFAELDDFADVVLLDARNDALAPSPFAGAAQEVVVVVSPASSSITAAYAAVKRMSRAHGRDRLRLLVNRARGAAAARLVETNMREVASRHLAVALDVLDSIPLDPAVLDSARIFRAAVDAAPAAPASRRFRALASAIARWPAAHDDVSRLDTFMQRAIHGSRSSAARAGV